MSKITQTFWHFWKKKGTWGMSGGCNWVTWFQCLHATISFCPCIFPIFHLTVFCNLFFSSQSCQLIGCGLLVLDLRAWIVSLMWGGGRRVRDQLSQFHCEKFHVYVMYKTLHCISFDYFPLLFFWSHKLWKPFRFLYCFSSSIHLFSFCSMSIHK